MSTHNGGNLPTYPLQNDDKVLIQLAEQLRMVHSLRISTSDVVELFVALDYGTEKNRWLSQSDLGEAAGTTQSTISRYLRKGQWLEPFCNCTPNGIRLRRNVLDARAAEHLDSGAVEEIKYEIKRQRQITVSRKQTSTPKLWKQEAIDNIISYYTWPDGTMRKDQEDWAIWEEWLECLAFIKYSLDNPLANPYDLDMFSADLFPGAYQSDWVGNMKDWKDSLVENHAHIQLWLFIHYAMLMWLQSRNDGLDNLERTQALQELTHLVPKQSKKLLKENFEAFEFFHPNRFPRT